MIDIENYVITALADAIQLKYPNAVVLGDYPEEFATFPAVTVNEIEKATLRRMQDPELTEHYATVTYEVNVYCNNRVGKKEICKDILAIADEVMFRMKFRRYRFKRLPNIDRTIYRMYTRYTAIVDEGTDDGNGNITYQMYRA